MDFLIFSLFFTLGSAENPDVCFPSVVRHRIDSIFPTSSLFCVSKQNDELKYGPLEIINDDEQWSQYSKSRFQDIEAERNADLNLLYFGGLSSARLFKLPASISSSGFCTGTQNVEIKQNLTMKCKPLAVPNMSSQCTENYFLSALAMFGNGEFLELLDNKTVVVPKTENIDYLRAPLWNGSMCTGVVRSANLVFHFNETRVTTVEADIEFTDLPGNVDNNWFEQTFTVQWLHDKIITRNEAETNLTVDAKGYKLVDQVYRVQGSTPVPFAVPTLGNCYSEQIYPSPVLFLRPIMSVCTISTINCDDARSKARAFYDQVYPSELVSSLSSSAQSVITGRVNVTWEELSPSVTSCRLPVSSLLQIYYSKQGSTKNFYEVIVGGNIQLLLDDVSYRPGQLIRMPLSISFTDVTQPPKHIFAALPYIDIRLPHDFFYPFIRSSSSVSIYYESISYFCLLIIIAYE